MSQKEGFLYNQRTPITFSTTINPLASSQLPYKIISSSYLMDITISFPLNQQRQLQISICVGQTGTSVDKSIFNTYTGSGVNYVIGDDNQLIYKDLKIYIESGYFITVVGANQDTVNPHTLDVQLVIMRAEIS